MEIIKSNNRVNLQILKKIGNCVFSKDNLLKKISNQNKSLSIYCGNKNSIQLSNFQSNNQRLTINKNNTLFPKQFINSNFQFQQKNLNSTVSLNKPNSFTLLPFLIKKRIVNSDDSNNSRKKFILKRKYCILDDKNCNSNIILNNLIKKNAFDYSKNVCKTSSIISKSQFHSSKLMNFIYYFECF